MKLIKKNQLAISVIALMLITAGYLSYDTNTQNKEGLEASTGLNESLDLASLRRRGACKHRRNRRKQRTSKRCAKTRRNKTRSYSCSKRNKDR